MNITNMRQRNRVNDSTGTFIFQIRKLSLNRDRLLQGHEEEVLILKIHLQVCQELGSRICFVLNKTVMLLALTLLYCPFGPLYMPIFNMLLGA